MPNTYIENKEERVVFTKQMKKDYTILIPNMLPLHFDLIEAIFRKHGYKAEVMRDDSRDNIDVGVKYVHNDACYPAICTIGQLIKGFESGKYDKSKTALLISQTGGGCRASNYLSMLRKALKRAGYDNVPVLSFNIAGLEKNPGFSFTLPFARDLMYAVIYGDLLMSLKNQCIVREVNKGETEKLLKHWVSACIKQLNGNLSFSELKKTMKKIAADFSVIELGAEVPRVGIVGEIYVKFAPLGNNNLEDFLHSEGAESVVPGFLDFCYYCVRNNVFDNELYGMGAKMLPVWKLACKFLESLKDTMNATLEEYGFMHFSSYKHLIALAQEKGCLNMGCKMGEGWLLTSEMIEFCDMGIKNIICTQPFGCLPNHIIAKGMMHPVKECYPDANIVAIDYDPGASRINQENRIKLMLSNARK